MKIAFFFPAKLVLADLPSSWILSPVPGAPLPFFTLSVYPWYCTKTLKVKSNALADGASYLLLEIEPDVFLPLTTTFDLPAFIEARAATICESLPVWRGYLADPARYGQEQAERLAKVKAEREASDLAKAERESKEAATAEAAYQSRLSAFTSGASQLPLHDFERACKDNGVKMPIKTLGWAREHITAVGLKTATGTAKHNSPHFWRAVRELQEKLETNSGHNDVTL